MASDISPRWPVTWADPGRGTVAAVADAVRRLQGDDPLRTVVVITQPGPTAATLRRLLPRVDPGGRGMVGLRFTTVPDLALDLSPTHVRRKRPVTPLVLAAAVERELADRCPPVLAGVRTHAATVDALVDAADRLRFLRLAPAGSVGALVGGSPVRAAVVEVATRSRASLVGQFRDEAETLQAAMGELAAGRAVLNEPVVFVATDAVHPVQVPLLGAVFGAALQVEVVAARVAVSDVDRIAQLSLLLGSDLAFLDDPVPPRIVECPDGDEEARWVVRRIVHSVTDGGVVPEQIAVMYPPGTGYGRSLRDQLQLAGVHSSGPAIDTVAGSMAGQALRMIVEMVVESGGATRQRMLRMFAIAPRWTTPSGALRPVARWRSLCRQASIVTEADWSTGTERLAIAQAARRARFADARTGAEQSSDAATEQSSEPVAEPSQFDLDDLERLGTLIRVVGGIVRSVRAARRATTWQAAVDALAEVLRQSIGDSAWRDVHWTDTPLWQRRAADQVVVLLEALVQYDQPATALAYKPAVLRRLVAAELDRKVSKAGNTTVGVRLLPLQHGVCLDADELYVVGLNDGVVPPGRVDDLVVGRTLDPSCSTWIQHIDWQRHQLHRSWEALLASGAQVTVTLARTDGRRGGKQYPSPWLSRPAWLDSRGEPLRPIEVHASFAAGLANGPALTISETAAAHPIDAAAASSVLHQRAMALAARVADEPTEFEGMLGASHIAHSPAGRVQGITRFENFAGCGLAYLLAHVLGVGDDADASEITEIEPRDKGTLVHGVLEQLVLEWLAMEPRPEWLEPVHLAAAKQRAAELLDLGASGLRAVNRLGNEVAWQIERGMVLTAIARFLDSDRGVTPVAVEQRFGYGVQSPAITFDVVGVGVVGFRGSVDRVDQTPSGVRVTDFKTSNAVNVPRYSASEVDAGQKLQLPMYSRAMGADAARYVYLRRSHADAVEFKELGDFDLDAMIRRIATAIHLGEFLAGVPGNFGCNACSPDGLGLGDVTARAERWDRGLQMPAQGPT